MRRRTALVACTAAIAVGTAGVVVIPLIWGSPRRHVDAVAPVDPGAATRLASEPPSAVSTPRPGSRSRISRPPVAQHAVPVRVTAASVGIAAAVDPVGVDPAGDVAIPERVDTVGWYRFGARPGMAHGSTVLVGHVDSAVQGIGAFFHLHEIERGARLTVKLSSGAVAAYRVIAREEFPKGSVPLGALFSLTGAPRLTLITCGGSFDAHARSYRDNVVVTAVPG